jgi:hypothetical protein
MRALGTVARLGSVGECDHWLIQSRGSCAWFVPGTRPAWSAIARCGGAGSGSLRGSPTLPRSSAWDQAVTYHGSPPNHVRGRHKQDALALAVTSSIISATSRRKVRQNGGMTEPLEHQTQASKDVPVGSTSSRDQLWSLISQAFEKARESGRPDWQEMTVAVLKNRLLDQTGRSFNEMDFGSRTIGELIGRFPNLLLFDDSKRPPTVKLLRTDLQQIQDIPPTVDGHIRNDLWNAVIDYRSGKRYLWNGSIAIPESDSRGLNSDTFIMPTIEPGTMATWRNEFAESAKELVADEPELQGQLERWRSENRSVRALPAVLQRRWSATLSTNVLRTLTDWFSELAIATPLDMIQPRTPPRPHNRAQKQVLLVSPRDAGDLYQAMQRSRVLVVSLKSCSVRTDPTEDPPRLRRTRPLEEFVQYKASYANLRGPGDPGRVLSGFLESSPMKLCADSRDPRVLPLHVFDDERCWVDLHTPEGMEDFKRQYGNGSVRLDSVKREWSPALALHGSDTLTVDGLTLVKGFHWDVKRGKSAERLVTCHEVWKVGPGGYANVYPDAYVRSGSQNCRRIWAA